MTTGKEIDEIMKSALIEIAVTEFLLITFIMYFRQLLTIRVFRYCAPLDWLRTDRNGGEMKHQMMIANVLGTDI